MNKFVISPRIGCPPYLNSRPLIEGLEYPVIKNVPSLLCEAFLKRELDVALLSSIDVIRFCTSAVADISISCHGSVKSVFLAYTGDLRDLHTVQLDPSSHTSNYLAKIILREFYGLTLQYVFPLDRHGIDFPAILIGDAALELRYSNSKPQLKFMDLGEEWNINTNLPFVFALWAIQHDYAEKSFISNIMRKTKERGLLHIDEISRSTYHPNLSKSYLDSSLNYNFGERERRGLKLFSDYLIKQDIKHTDPYSINYY